MKLSVLILTIVIAGISLYGCGHKDIGPLENIPLLTKEPKSIEFIGTRNIAWGDTAVSIPWYRIDADFNTIETAEFWQKITVPSGTKTTYVGRYGNLEWDELYEDGEITLAAKGIDFLVQDKFNVPPGPGFAYVVRWLYSEKSSNNLMSFKLDRYYIFCLDRQPKEQWLNEYTNEPGFEMDLELEHVIAIIEINPIFDYNTQSTSSPIHLTEENLLVYRQEREGYKSSYKLEFGVERKKNNRFEYLTPKGNVRPDVKPETIQKLLYAINTIPWEQKESPHTFKEPAVTHTLIEYLDDEGLRKKAVIEYDNGGWHMKHPDNRYYSSYFPYLLFEVEKDAEYDLDIFLLSRNIENNTDNVEALGSRGDLYDKAGKTEKACFDYKHLCELGDCSSYASSCLSESNDDAAEYIDHELIEKIAVESTDEWIRRDSAENLKNQILLSKIAVEDRSPEVRRSAAKNLTDQALLARIAVNDENEYVRSAAVENLNDQDLLLKIIEEDKNPWVRGSAVNKLTDQAILARLALEDKDPVVRSVAVANLNNQALLSRIAVTDEDPNIRRTATEHVLDQDLLAKIAVEDSMEEVRSIAAEKLTDQTVLRKIAVEDERPKVRRAAVKNLTDQPLLARIALTDKDAAVQKAAGTRVFDNALLSEMGMWVKPELTSQVTDQTLLEKIVMEASDTDVRMAAVKNLTNQDLLGKLALEDKEFILRLFAIQKLTDQTLLLKLALEDFGSVALDAVERLTDQNLIAKVAMESKDSMIRSMAADRLTDKTVLTRMGMWVDPELTCKVTDQTLLAKIAVEGRDSSVRKAAVGNLTDTELLSKIAVEDEDWVVRVAALRGMARRRPDETTRKFIEQRAAQDESSQARDEISQILLEKWPDTKE